MNPTPDIDRDDWLERLAMPYFACAAEWYATIGIGVTGGTLDAIARKLNVGPDEIMTY